MWGLSNDNKMLGWGKIELMQRHYRLSGANGTGIVRSQFHHFRTIPRHPRSSEQIWISHNNWSLNMDPKYGIFHNMDNLDIKKVEAQIWISHNMDSESPKLLECPSKPKWSPKKWRHGQPKVAPLLVSLSSSPVATCEMSPGSFYLMFTW